MDILFNTIKSLNNEEVINYKLYTYRKGKDIGRKDILLFDIIKKSNFNDANENEVFLSLYPKSTPKNTFHRLKSRLLIEINNSIIQFYFNKNEAHYIFNELCLYRTFLQKNKYDIALYHLNKAETRALQGFDYASLDIIYHEYINLSVQYGNIIPSIYIEKRKNNTHYLTDIRELDDALAIIVYDLKRTQNFSKTNIDKVNALNNAIKKINSKPIFKKQLLFKYKMYDAISSLLITQKDFTTLETYCKKTFEDFSTNKIFTKTNHQVKLKILVHLCNALTANKKNKEALDYLKHLKKALSEFENLYYNEFVFFYYNSLANNYSVIEVSKAIEVLNEAKNITSIQQNKHQLGYVYLNLAGAYFDLKEHKTALKNIINIYNNTAFVLLEEQIKLKIIIHELILRVELNDFTYAIKLINTIHKTYRKLLKTPENKIDLDFLFLLNKIIHKDNILFTKKTQLLFSQFINNKQLMSSNSIINYKEWLNSLLTK